METFNRKLNMIKITGLTILLFLVKHGNAKTTSATSSPVVTNTAESSSTAPTASTIASSSNGAAINSKNMSSSSPLSTTTTTLPTTTTLTTTTAPDECYEISCNNVTCGINENYTVNFPNKEQKCTRPSTGSCYVKQTVDSANANTVNYSIGCSAVKCDGKLNTTVSGNVTDTISCCQGNLCNGVFNKSEGRLVNYNLLLSVLCIVLSLF